jgi:hypothetical protein
MRSKIMFKFYCNYELEKFIVELAIVPGVFLFGFAYGFKFAKIIKIIV